jgi:hypothetical protein
MSASPRAAALKQRALAELSKAFEESRGELSCDWVRTGDLDLASLRDDPALALVLRRYCSGEEPAGRDDDEDWQAEMGKHQAREGEMRLRGYPARPWGDPERRATGWAITTVTGVEAAVVYSLATDPFGEWADLFGLLALVALVAFSIARGVFAWREARRSDAEEQALRLERRRGGGNQPLISAGGRS